MTAARFLILNTVGWIAVCIATIFAALRASARWVVVVPLATVMAINGAAHGLASLLTVSYAPGVISGLFLWVPFGVFTVQRGYRVLAPRLFRILVAIGIALHGVVILLALAP